MRIRLTSALVIALAALLVAPATAGHSEIVATPQNTWEPSQVTVEPGHTVNFRNGGGVHNLVFDDGERTVPQPRGDAWTASRTFESPGTYRFVCEPHESVGMRGAVRVVDPDADPAVAVTLAIRRALRVGSRLSVAGVVDRRLAGERVELLVGDGSRVIGRAGLRVDERGRVGASGTLPARAARATSLLVAIRTPRSEEFLPAIQIARTARQSPGLTARSGRRTETSLTVTGNVSANLQSRVTMVVRYLDEQDRPQRARGVARRLSDRWQAQVPVPSGAKDGIVYISTRGDRGRYGQGLSARLPGS